MPRSSSPTRALVLGGGGVFGVAWQTSYLTSLREHGLDLSTADVIVGTSAGSLVGALLAADGDLVDAYKAITDLADTVDDDSLTAGSQALVQAMEQAGLNDDPNPALTAVGHLARNAPTISESTFLSIFGSLTDLPWPPAFRCTGIDIDSGELITWGPESGISVQRAVAASCAVPAIFPTVSVRGRHYMDGGIHSHLNATAASPTDVLLALSCFPLTDHSTPAAEDSAASAVVVDAELDQLRSTRHVLAIAPEIVTELAPINVMDPRLVPQAAEAGAQQAAKDASRLQHLWNP